MVSRKVLAVLACCMLWCSAVIAGYGISKSDAAEASRADVVTTEEAKQSKEKEKSSESSYKMEEVVVVANPLVEGNATNRLGSQVTTVTEQ